jgi:hypothetical protein
MHRKPSQPPTYIVFPKQGPVSLVAEPLPNEKNDLEQAIGNKFIFAVQQRFGRILSAPTPGEEWPDLWSCEGSERIGIEVVEIVNAEHITLGGYGVPQSVAVEVAQRLLLGTIQAKLAKNYPTPSDWKLWLLAYDATHALVGKEVEAAHLANEALQSKVHPFAEIWLITPTPYQEIPSFLESVWPTTLFTSTELR